MKISISYTGNLKVVAENETELYALKNWIEASVEYTDDDKISINMGSFDVTDNFIEDNEGLDSSLLDHVIEMRG